MLRIPAKNFKLFHFYTKHIFHNNFYLKNYAQLLHNPEEVNFVLEHLLDARSEQTNYYATKRDS